MLNFRSYLPFAVTNHTDLGDLPKVKSLSSYHDKSNYFFKCS